MRLLTYTPIEGPTLPRLGAALGEYVIDLEEASTWAQGARGLPREHLPASLPELIYAGSPTWEYVRRLVAALEGQDPTHLKGAHRRPVGFLQETVFLFSPLLRPPTVRDFYAFEAHVAAAHAARGREVAPEWYQFPVFYFSNPNAIYGPDTSVPYPSSSQELDFELEVACVIGKTGRDIPANEAEAYIFGYTIFNDWSARDVQSLEMRVGLGPAKGKDFASSLGPWIVTPDELQDRATGRPGVYDLKMTAKINGQERSRGNWKDLHYSFGDMIARASADTWLFPGEILASGTVGTGCLLELTGGQGPWLQVNDLVELHIERLGTLSNRVAPPAKAQKENPSKGA